MRKTKIICTLGPASTDPEVIRQLVLEGMNIARFNFSHGSHEEHLVKINTIRDLRKELGVPLAILLDTRGPEIRLGLFKDGKATLTAGNTFTLTTKDIEGTEKMVSVTYKNLPADIKKGDRILLDDGLIELKVMSIKGGTDIVCQVINSGTISNRKGVNLPGVSISMPYLNESDKRDIVFGIKQGFDFIAASFVRTAQDIMDIKNLLIKNNGRQIKIIAKIENLEGVENLDEILKIADGIMVARGDLGVEIDMEEIPILQKMMIDKCYTSGKMVITATQMLESMIKNPRPTRAEASDVANAIYDGTSAIMLSGETAAGAYPIETVRTMAKIAERVEEDIDYVKRFHNRHTSNTPSITDAISHATCTSAHNLAATAIVTVSRSGRTARMISKYRPSVPIIACTCSEATYHQLALSWGVIPVMIGEYTSTDELLESAIDSAMKNSGIINDGDLIVISAGIPVGHSGTTNLLKVQTVGNSLLQGSGLTTSGVSSGNVCVAQTNEELFANFNFGDIVVCDDTCDLWMKMLTHATGVIAEKASFSHISTIAEQLNIPVICGAENCCEILKTGTKVRMDSIRGTVTAITDAEMGE